MKIGAANQLKVHVIAWIMGDVLAGQNKNHNVSLIRIQFKMRLFFGRGCNLLFISRE